MKKTKYALLSSVLALVLCVSMLIGSTFAWFTDSVSTGNNVIKAGNLDVEVEYSTDMTNWKSVEGATDIFNPNALWEPGHTEVVYLRVSNKGDLALKYQLGINVLAETGSTNVLGERFLLSDYIEFGVINDVSAAFADREAARKAVKKAAKLSSGYSDQDALPVGADPKYVAVVVYMPESVGNEANTRTGAKTPTITMGVDLFATQYTSESDSFGNNYDAGATLPNFVGKISISADVTGNLTADNKIESALTIRNSVSDMSVNVPAGVQIADGVTELSLEIERTERSSNISLNNDQVSVSLDVHVDGIADDNQVPMTVNLGAILPAGLKQSSVELYHVENGVATKMSAADSFTEHNQYKYDATTGEVSIYIKSFSEITMLISPNDPWAGTIDTSWYKEGVTEFTLTTAEELAGLGTLVANGNTFAGKTIKLGNSINLGSESNKVFLPIGYDPNVSTSTIGAFEGIFDGQGYTIRNLYQSTWTITGDYDNGYYKKSMGLFALINGGTVKNLNLYRFEMEGEYAPMGCVAGRASGGTFENIRLIECHPATYNTGVAGIVGWDVSEGATYSFSNIEIDPTNTISALWGTYDAACGGIMGYLSESSTANFTNCNIGCVLDVYNDVCGNYQYYQYRYSGMLVGTVGMDTSADISKITCDNVNVYYNDWVHYFYCEFEKNSQASYTDDYQFSRVPHSELTFTDSNGNGKIDTAEEAASVTGCTHIHTEAEDKQAVYLPFNQMISGYGWGADHIDVKNVGITDYDYTVTYMDGTDVLLVEYRNNDTTYVISHTAAEFDKNFERWVNVGGQVISSVDAGNTSDITLYADWVNEYVVRFVDQHGNLVDEVAFDSDTGNLRGTAPAVPDIGADFTREWESYTLQGATADVTVRPVYTYKGNLKLTPVDSDGDGVTNYYRVDAVDNLTGSVTVPGYVNGVQVKVVADICSDWNNGFFKDGITDITFEEGVETISAQSLAFTIKLNTISLPSTLEYIGKNAFASVIAQWIPIKTVSITYNGTWEQFKQITKEDGWDNGLANGSTITCNDGNVYEKMNSGWNLTN